MYNFFLRKEEDCSISSEIFLNPTTLRIKKQVAKAASGIITEFVRKSKKSRNAIPTVKINRGFLKMGMETQDSLWGMKTPRKDVSVVYG